ncbi:hypothetical protein [Shimia sp.]|uniref:tetratricopeptide repeat protein n=1 Tax=Shimia sp. TaxID=1954381 RepID=UPI003BA91983
MAKFSFKTVFHLKFHGLFLGALAALCCPVEINAEPLKLEFRPPEIAPQNVCVSRSSDQDTIAFWEDWGGQSFAGMKTALVKRDIKRLQHIDAKRWLPTIEKVILLLEELDPSYAGKNALLARIQAMQAAGEYDRIRNLQLVQQLASAANEASPRIQNALASFYRSGIGVERDVALADQLLISAGYAGNADALLALAKRDLSGNPVAGWDVPNELSVTMAFGALVGELNTTICDRTARIAREFRNGEVVAPNAELAREWFRFSADLGDANAAWKLVEYHMQSEEFDKDNDVLLRYLRQAADAGLPFAQIELGRLYEQGALVEQDLDQSLALFRAAAQSNQRPGLTRLGLFIEEHEEVYPHLVEEKIETFNKLATLPDAPGWVFTRLAAHAQLSQGRWVGIDAALPLLERAAELGDMEGTARLAQLLLAKDRSAVSFERAVNLLSRVVSLHGGVTPSKQLHAAFMCQAADSPRLVEASYWGDIEAATDTANVELSGAEIVSLVSSQDPSTVAVLQSQALYGRPSSLASWIKFLDLDPNADAELRHFWEVYSGQFNFVLEALAKLELELAASPDDRVAAFNLLRREFQKSGAEAAVTLARALLEDNSGEVNDEITEILRVSARLGIGDAIQLLASLRSQNGTPHDVYLEYKELIERDGDFDALLFAVPFLEMPDRIRYMDRAVSLIQCDYKNAMKLAHVAFLNGMEDLGMQWLDISAHLTGENAWAYRDLAEAKLAYEGSPAAVHAKELFELAIAAGDASAKHKLFDLMIDPDAETFAPERAALMIEQALETEDHETLSAYLGRYRRADGQVKSVLEARLDLPQIQRVAAETGDIFAMRSYGVYLRETAEGASDLSASTLWLKRAAEGGDVTAMADYGQALAFGIGTEPDLGAAKQWLAAAAEQGNQKAGEIIRLVALSAGEGS